MENQSVDIKISPVEAKFPSDYLHESYILNLIPEAVYMCDLSGVIVKYNEQAVQLWGRRPLIGDLNERFNGAWKLYYTDGYPLPHELSPAAACLKDGIPRRGIELIIERPDNSKINVEVNVIPIKDDNGHQIGIINCIYDNTEKKSTEKQLQRKTVELQDYVENASIGLHWVDENGIIKWANKAEMDLLGYDENEYIGHHIAEFHVNENKISEILTKLRCNETLKQYESEMRCKDGTIKTVHISSNVFREDGKFIHTRCFTVDVTEQKKLVKEIIESEVRYKNLVNSLPVAIYTCNKDGAITFFNEVAVQLWGYRPDINNELLKYCACHKVYWEGKQIHPDETPMAIALHTGKAFRNIEAYVERPDGSVFFASINIDPLFDANGDLIGAINVFQDVTNSKQIEAALRDSESKYRQLIHILETPLYTTDTEGRITLYNKAAAELWGREPVIGKDLWCGSFQILNVDGSDMPLDTCPMAICLKEKRPVYGEEILVVRPDGSIRNVAPHPQPVFDSAGNMTGAINMLIDITRMKEAENALRESETKYRILANSLEKEVEKKVQDLKSKSEDLKKSEERYHKMVEEVEDYSIILLDKEGIVQNWNKGAEKIKGYKEEEIVGKSFQVFYLPNDTKSGIPLQLLNHARETGKAIHEGWRKRKDNSIFWASTVITALHDLQGNVTGFSKVTRDLTERKQSEDKMQEYLNQLEFQNRELEQFVYAASHDLKEPIRKIHFYSDYIAEDGLSQLSDKSRDYLNRSINAADRMKKLIDDLLIYSRTTAKVESYETVDLNKLMEEVTHIFKEEMEHFDITVDLEKLTVIKAVPFQIKQLLVNLFDNAVKYKHPERRLQVSITYKQVPGDVIPEFMAEGRVMYHMICVKDNGIGFEPLYAKKLFNIFHRLKNVSEASGSGIGLAICKRIVQNHNGFILASGKPNEGAIFSIYLPVQL
ncbi:PAS domain S-box protein [Niastella sp. OAS944]|uniref:PAS domain S-box protein n=1 Tax=Niastella sp. OAS944 TaxID=2664089 RepID=UPI00347E4151|nr:PAS domain S-box-containing protein [Chitinophagaceae bacterium OAS944]